MKRVMSKKGEKGVTSIGGRKAKLADGRNECPSGLKELLELNDTLPPGVSRLQIEKMLRQDLKGQALRFPDWQDIYRSHSNPKESATKHDQVPRPTLLGLLD